MQEYASRINYDLEQRRHQLSGLFLGYACLTVQYLY